jgi:methionyl-tRNA formyltransferase
MKIVFMGTPDFAVVILEKIIQEQMEVVGVITAPDRPAGRGQKINESAVKQCAVRHGVPILQPTNLKDEAFQTDLRNWGADLFIVVAFRMLPETVWAMPPMGTINLHGSLLPMYRGAAPINWAIINGEKETGVTSFFIERQIDTGKILIQEKMTIGENMTAGELHDVLAEMGADVITKTIVSIKEGTTNPVDQESFDLSQIKNAPKIFKEDCKINWSRSANEVHDFIRGLSPYPAAWTSLNKEEKSFGCKIFNSKVTNQEIQGNKVLSTPNGFLLPCSDYYICITEIQLEGKRRMTFKEFSAGNNIADFSISE